MAALAPCAAFAEEPDWRAEAARGAALLSELIRVESVNPPGNEEPAARILAAWLDDAGIESEVIVSAPGRGNLVARLPATVPVPLGPPLLLLAHLDVVPAAPDAWPFPPFSGEIRDGRVFGRGAIDDKGQAAVFAAALALIAADGGARHRELIFAATAGEEVDGHGVVHLLEAHPMRLGPPWAVWNEGGGTTPAGLLGGRLVNGIATAEKRALWLTLRTTGEGGHGSQPIRRAAVNRLVRALERIDAWETPVRITATVGEQFRRIAAAAPFPESFFLARLDSGWILRLTQGSLAADPLTRAMLRDTVSLTGVRAGVKHNVIPRRAEAMLDVRLLPDSDAQGFLGALAAVIDDPSVAIEPVGEIPGVVAASPLDHPLFAAIEAEMDAELPGSITVPLLTAGSTDSVFFRARGIPAYGFLPAVLSPEMNQGIHGVGEHLPIVELERALRVTWRVLRRIVSVDGGN